MRQPSCLYSAVILTRAVISIRRRPPRPVRSSLSHRRCAGLALALAVLMTLIGVQPVRAAWAPGGDLPGLGKGAIWSLAFDPTNPAIALAGTDAGIYRSVDAGVTWTRVASAGKRIWAVGFSGHTALAGTAGSGILLSADDGATWKTSSAGLKATQQNVRELAIGLSAIAAGTDSGVVVSIDAGQHWRSAGLDDFSIDSLTVSANAPAFTVIAGVDLGDTGHGYLFRNSGLASATWEVLNNNLPEKAVPSSVTAGPLAQGATVRPLLLTTTKGTWRSGDGGGTWSEGTCASGAKSPLCLGTATNSGHLTLTTAAFSPLDPNLVYGGGDAGQSSTADLIRSADGGATFSDFGEGLPDKQRNVTAIAVAPTAPPLVLAGLSPLGGGHVYRLSDTQAGAPPALAPEGPGAVPPSTIPTPPPTARSTGGAASGNTKRASPSTGLVATIFHWPLPLLPELLVLLGAGWLALRWRERYLEIEGPP
jgi:hypothetical protein